jgi:acetoin utilization deacetylase AcuC-like enzyme
MTKKLMSLAEGKVVLTLEGGYHKESLCDCAEMCLNALLDKQIPSFSNQTLNTLPNSPAIQDLERTIDIQSETIYLFCYN